MEMLRTSPGQGCAPTFFLSRRLAVGWVIHPPYTGGTDSARMSNYRRAPVPGAAYFFTVALADRQSRVLVEHGDALRSGFVATASRAR